MELNQNEQTVLELLRYDPYISQKELANKIGLSRPAVANLISSLQQKGYILGKPYVLRNESYITCVGGANMDVTFTLEEPLQMGTSNPVISSTSLGGVVRNVAENLSRLNVPVSLMTLVGNDSFGTDILTESNKLMEVFASDKRKDDRTGSYHSIINQNGEMSVGFADMTINNHMDRSWILEHKRHLLMSSWIVADLNISVSGLEALLEFHEENRIPLAVVGVSSPKMKHLPKEIEGIDLLICNKDESQTYFEVEEESVQMLCQMWLDKGVKRVVVTDGKNGSYYGEDGTVFHQQAFLVKQENVIDVTGAGDAFSSAVIYGIAHDMSLSKSVEMGAVNSSLTIQVANAVNPNLSIKSIQKELQK